jgi:hypothetical protein
MAEIKHSGGIVEAVLELGFDAVKYFESDVTSTAIGFSITPPARRVFVANRNTAGDSLYVRINPADGETAEASVSFVPGDNIKLDPGCDFTMDFDAVHELSFVTSTGTVAMEGLLGFKGTGGC